MNDSLKNIVYWIAWFRISDAIRKMVAPHQPHQQATALAMCEHQVFDQLLLGTGVFRHIDFTADPEAILNQLELNLDGLDPRDLMCDAIRRSRRTMVA